MAVKIEGYTPEEILQFTDDDLSPYLFEDGSLTLRIGSAEILGQVRRTDMCLTIELAHIEGGGEGVLPTLWVLANQYAKRCEISQVEWIVHAVSCAQPNLKLRHMLERRGFVVTSIEGIGDAYYLKYDL